METQVHHVLKETMKEEKVIYAGFWIRSIAFLFDSFIFLCFSLLFEDINFDFENFDTYSLVFYSFSDIVHSIFIDIFTPGFMIGLFIGWLYFAGLHSSKWQATIGMKICGIKVSNLQGERVNILQATLRWACSWISYVLLGIGYLMIAFTYKKQSLHDRVATTLVIHHT